MTSKAVHLHVLRGNEDEEDTAGKYPAETGEEEVEYPEETYETSYEEQGLDGERVVVYDDVDEYGAMIASMQVIEESDDSLHIAAVTAASAAGDVSIADDLVTAVKNQYELRGSGHAPKPTGRTAKQLKDDAKKNWASQTNVRPAHAQTDKINRQGLTAIIKVNGTDAYTCWDTGSELDAITPDFTRATEMDHLTKAEPLDIRLATKGSGSATSYETRPELNFGNLKVCHGLDIVNLDRYDVLLGSPFCNKYQVSLNYGDRTVRFGDTVIKALSKEEETTARKRGQTATLHAMAP
jgi:hypothetical protein